MPKGYVIFSEKIQDQPKYEAYVQKTVPAVLQSGGRPIVFHKGVDVIEGKWDAQQVVVLEFDSVEAAKKL